MQFREARRWPESSARPVRVPMEGLRHDEHDNLSDSLDLASDSRATRRLPSWDRGVRMVVRGDNGAAPRVASALRQRWEMTTTGFFMLPLKFDESAPFGLFTEAPSEHRGRFHHPARERPATRRPQANLMNRIIIPLCALRNEGARDLPSNAENEKPGVGGELPARAGPISHVERPGTRYCETRRYPTPRTVSMREACSPSFWRSVRTCMSTVRLPPAKSHPHTCCSRASRERATPGFSMK